MNLKSIAFSLFTFVIFSIASITTVYANDQLAGLGGLLDKVKKQAEDKIKKTVEEATKTSSPQPTESSKDLPTSSTEEVNLKTLPVGGSASPNSRYRYVSLFDSRSSNGKRATTAEELVLASRKKSGECDIEAGSEAMHASCLAVNNKGNIAIYNKGNSEFRINDGKQNKVVSVSQIPAGRYFNFGTNGARRKSGVFNDADQIAYLSFKDVGSSLSAVDSIGYFDGASLKKIDFQGKLNLERVNAIALSDKSLITLFSNRSATSSLPLMDDYTDVYTVNSLGEIKSKFSVKSRSDLKIFINDNGMTAFLGDSIPKTGISRVQGLAECLGKDVSGSWSLAGNDKVYFANRKEIYYCNGAIKQVIAKEDELQDFSLMDRLSVAASGAVGYVALHNRKSEIYFWNGNNSRLVADVNGSYKFFTNILSASNSGVLFEAQLKKPRDSNYQSENGLFVGSDAVRDRVVGERDRLFDGMVAKYTPLKLTDTGQVVFIVTLVTPTSLAETWTQIVRAEPL